MRKESLGFLEEIMSLPSPSGFEQPVQRVVRKQVAKYAHEVKTDVHGNVVATLNPQGSPRVMLAGHCDQIGLMVQHLTEEGFVHFSAIGGIDTSVVPGLRVVIHGPKGPVPGLIGRKPIHLQTPEERKNAKIEIHKLWIDLGAADKQAAEKVIEVGNAITFDLGLMRLQDQRVAGAGFDDKVGVLVVMEALRLLARRKLDCAVFAVSTVQEELGLRGARTSAFSINPQVAIAVDVTFATDHPDMDKARIGDIKLGAGPVIARGPNINPVVHELLVQAAKQKRLSWQTEAIPKASGTDANVMQISREGVAAGLISVPSRYMHTPVEVISLDDAANAATLLAEAVAGIGPDRDFIPR